MKGARSPWPALAVAGGRCDDAPARDDRSCLDRLRSHRARDRPCGQVPRGADPGQGWHGRRRRGAPHQARRARGDQVPAPRVSPGTPRRPRGSCARPRPPAGSRASTSRASRRRHAGVGRAVHGDGVPRRAGPWPSARELGGALHPRRGRLRHPGLRGARRGARARHRPPRHQAREPLPHARARRLAHRQGARLRHLQDDRGPRRQPHQDRDHRWARRSTCRRSRCSRPASSIPAPTSMRWASRSTRCSPASSPSSPTPCPSSARRVFTGTPTPLRSMRADVPEALAVRVRAGATPAIAATATVGRRARRGARALRAAALRPDDRSHRAHEHDRAAVFTAGIARGGAGGSRLHPGLGIATGNRGHAPALHARAVLPSAHPGGRPAAAPAAPTATAECPPHRAGPVPGAGEHARGGELRAGCDQRRQPVDEPADDQRRPQQGRRLRPGGVRDARDGRHGHGALGDREARLVERGLAAAERCGAVE